MMKKIGLTAIRKKKSLPDKERCKLWSVKTMRKLTDIRKMTVFRKSSIKRILLDLREAFMR